MSKTPAERKAIATAEPLTEATRGAYRRRKGFTRTIYQEIRQWIARNPLSPEDHRVWWNNIDAESREAIHPSPAKGGCDATLQD